LHLTAFLALKLFQPEFVHVVIPFDNIIDAVKDHQVDAGLLIHEGQLTYGHGGLHNVLDLGKWFKSKYRLPLPLGANALRRNLPAEIQSECSKLLRESIQYSLDHREEALNYAMQFARDLEPALAEQFVGMYVNQNTIDGGEVVPRAAQKLLDLGYEAGLIPHKATIEVVR
jgi:1,4-dihydroxy-6-naphthoate synthase